MQWIDKILLKFLFWYFPYINDIYDKYLKYKDMHDDLNKSFDYQTEQLKELMQSEQNLMIHNLKHKEEIQYQKSYIKVLEDKIDECKKKKSLAKKELPKKEYSDQYEIEQSSRKLLNKTEFNPDSDYFRDHWTMVSFFVPNISVNEILVTDGEIVSAVRWDKPSNTFLKSFGSQVMRVPFPTAWKLLPKAPNIEKNTNQKIHSRPSMNICYNR